MTFDISNPQTDPDRKFLIIVNRMQHYFNNEDFTMARCYKNALIDHVKKERQNLSEDSIKCFRWLFLDNLKKISPETVSLITKNNNRILISPV